MEPVVVIPYAHFGTTLQDGTNRLSQNVGKELTLLAA